MAESSQTRWFTGVSMLLSLMALGFLVASCFRMPIDADSFVHLATGRNWLEYGLSPFVDHISFTYPGERVIGQPIAFQAMLYGYVQALGVEPGFVAMKFTFAFLTFATVVWLAWQSRSPWPLAAFVLAVLAFALQTRVQTRPELGIFLFTALAFLLYHRTLEGKMPGASVSNMIPIVLLTLVWVAWYNAIFAYVIFFGMFVDLALRQWDQRASIEEWFRWLGWGLLVFILGWGPPDFSHDFFSTLLFAEEWKQLVREWEPPVRFWTLPATWVLALAGAASIALCIKHRRIGLLIVLIVFIQQTLQIGRLIAPTGVVIACALLHLFSLNEKNSLDVVGNSLRSARVSVVALLLAGLTVTTSGYVASKYLKTNDFRGTVWPENLAQHLRANWRPGRIYSRMEEGSFFSWELGPAYKTYIDGRINLLFPLEFLKHHLEVKRSPAALETELQKYRVDYLVLPSDASSDPYLLELDGWTLDFADYNDLLFVKEQGRFAVSGALRQAPECWSPSLTSALREERETAREILPEGNSLYPLIRRMASRDDQSRSTKQLGPDPSDAFADWRSVRFAAYQAFDAGNDDLVVFLLSDQPYQIFKDGIILALAYLRGDQLIESNQMLRRLLSEPWLQFEQADLAGISLIFSELEKKGALDGLQTEAVREILRDAEQWPPQSSLKSFKTVRLCHRNLLEVRL